MTALLTVVTHLIRILLVLWYLTVKMETEPRLTVPTGIHFLNALHAVTLFSVPSLTKFISMFVKSGTQGSITYCHPKKLKSILKTSSSIVQ